MDEDPSHPPTRDQPAFSQAATGKDGNVTAERRNGRTTATWENLKAVEGIKWNMCRWQNYLCYLLLLIIIIVINYGSNGTHIQMEGIFSTWKAVQYLICFAFKWIRLGVEKYLKLIPWAQTSLNSLYHCMPTQKIASIRNISLKVSPTSDECIIEMDYWTRLIQLHL